MIPENSYQSPSDSYAYHTADFTAQWAGFGARFLAYLIDISAIAAFVYLFLGFDETFQRYSTTSGDTNARMEFLKQRNQIRDLSFIFYIIYCALLEGSAMQGTIGKRMIGLRVTDKNGDRLTMARSFGRNFAKILSYIPLGLGFLWVIWSKEKRGWHDMIAKTFVIKS